MLREAKENCEYLIVGVQCDPSFRDGKQKPVQSISERMIQLNGCKYVDEIVCYQTEEELENIFRTMNIDVRFIGEEYRGRHYTGKQICNERSIEIHYNKRYHNFSTSELRHRIYQKEREKNESTTNTISSYYPIG